ncbi:hypothetical protein RFI_23376 [Reticulomyxa filosa]|uniref:Cep192-like domain-containing protein n=1 Tax=Reticulomyxa filosa TaxID=46433 RepID=X6MKL3_RETFI|nr:hypothetical protein RFI_23376 [Reticulomyxa filosa]|eukprot:ETO13992.1 hypothetical protein RFI_23376 [Reticulomyxa filosa]
MQIEKEIESYQQDILKIHQLHISDPILVFRRWECNKTYTQKITMKNICSKTIYVTQTCPATTEFGVQIHQNTRSDFKKIDNEKNSVKDIKQQIFKIRGGHLIQMAIYFTPRKRVSCKKKMAEPSIRQFFEIDYCDTLKLKTTHGEFDILLMGKVPKESVCIPPTLDLGFVAIKETVSKTFEMINDGDVLLNYQWLTSDSLHLIITPHQGSLDVGESLQKKIKNKNTHTYTKKKKKNRVHPLVLSNGGHVEKQQVLVLHNPSLVNAHIQITGEQNDKSNFLITPTSATIAPKNRLNVTVAFTPKTVVHKCIERFTVSTLSGYYTTFTLIGNIQSLSISSIKHTLFFFFFFAYTSTKKKKKACIAITLNLL